jgi:hypothetical protein
MSLDHPERFRTLCQQLCREQGWELLPNGIHVPLPDGRGQVVALELFDYRDEVLVRLATVIGRADGPSRARLSVALRLNAEIPHGCFAIRDDDLVMTDTLLLADADAAELEASIRYLAETADRNELEIFGTDDH